VKNSRMSCLPEDKAKVKSFLKVYFSGVEDDYGTPILGSSYRQPGFDKDRARKFLGDKLSAMCGLATLPLGLPAVEVVQQAYHGTISRRPPYNVTQMTPGDSLLDQVMACRKSKEIVFNQKAAKLADDFVRQLINVQVRGKLKPCRLFDAATSFPNSTSLGYPKFVKGKVGIREYFAESLELGRLGWPLSDAVRYPGLIGARSVARGPYLYSKTRYVTQWSRVIGNWEKTLFIPMRDILKKLPTFCALVGSERVDAVVTGMMRRTTGPILSLDFSGFDASVPFPVINRVFGVIKDWFEDSAHQLINFVHAAFIGCPLIAPNAFIKDRAKGVPSGSVLTNLVDSLVNLWVMAYAAAVNGGRVTMACVQGDDGLYTFAGISDLSVLSETLFSELGMTIKMTADKNLISRREVVYLQNHHYIDYVIGGLCVGVRPAQRVICNMMGHERAPAQQNDWDAKFNCYRYLQQANNAHRHPRFRELCVWLWTYSGDYLRVALGKILQADPEVYLANDLLNVGDGERGKLPVAELATSPVVKTLVEYARSKRVSL
jgi:hypothetical protein